MAQALRCIQLVTVTYAQGLPSLQAVALRGMHRVYSQAAAQLNGASRVRSNREPAEILSPFRLRRDKGSGTTGFYAYSNKARGVGLTWRQSPHWCDDRALDQARRGLKRGTWTGPGAPVCFPISPAGSRTLATVLARCCLKKFRHKTIMYIGYWKVNEEAFW